MSGFEHDLLIERAQAGLSRTKAEGKTPGRPTALQNHDMEDIHERLSAGETVSAIAKKRSTSRQTIMRIRDAQAPAQQATEIHPLQVDVSRC